MKDRGNGHPIPNGGRKGSERNRRPMVKADFIVQHASQILTMPKDLGPVRNSGEDVGLCEGDVALAAAEGKVVWIGSQGDLDNGAVEVAPEATVVDAKGLVILPGLVDAHTHMVFAGERSAEFHARNAGATYLEIAERGGGILSTVKATRAASQEALVELALPRLAASLAFGVTSLEIKSGYGLNTATELKMLRTIQTLAQIHPATIVPTFLGAHTIPAEHRGDRGTYVNEVLHDMLPQVAEEGLATYCDVFVEKGAFAIGEGEWILSTARSLGLKARVHADQFTSGGGAELAAKMGAASADHLEGISAEGIEQMAQSGTVAVLLPGVSLFLGLDRWPPARALLDAGVRVALATDCNPGSCFTENLPLMTTLGCTYLKMSAEEVLAAVTVEGARSLGLDSRGHLTPGSSCDLAGFALPHYRYLPYHFGRSRADLVVKEGKILHQTLVEAR